MLVRAKIFQVSIFFMNRFPSLGSFVKKRVKNQPTFKKKVGLVFLIYNFFINKTAQQSKLVHEKNCT